MTFNVKEIAAKIQQILIDCKEGQLDEAVDLIMEEISKTHAAGLAQGIVEGLEKAALKADQIASQAGSKPEHRYITSTAEIIAKNIRALKEPRSE